MWSKSDFPSHGPGNWKLSPYPPSWGFCRCSTMGILQRVAMLFGHFELCSVTLKGTTVEITRTSSSTCLKTLLMQSLK